MRVSYIIGTAFVVFFILISMPSHAGTVTSRELVEAARELDGKTVTYRGEAMTAVMNRGEYSWVSLKDGYNTIGVWCKSDLLKEIRWVGGYKNKGDMVEVTGTFHMACPVHGGELDIHADEAIIMARGFPIEEHVSPYRIRIAAAFFILTLLAIFIFRDRI
ncbi:MAG: DNA-binding protein [Candidatus Omnitrophica bacterium]|nr:DNA-binding protein [Candidatus Omnitrophota bacterium]